MGRSDAGLADVGINVKEYVPFHTPLTGVSPAKAGVQPRAGAIRTEGCARSMPGSGKEGCIAARGNPYQRWKQCIAPRLGRGRLLELEQCETVNGQRNRENWPSGEKLCAATSHRK